MANELELLPKYLSENVINLRKKRGLSQMELARAAGIPRSTVTYIESGAGNPSLQNLTRLSLALQTPIEELLSAPPQSYNLVKAADVPRQTRHQGSAVVYKLLPDHTPGMLLDRFEMEPGARMGGVPHLGGTKEYLTCVQGEVIAHVSGDSFHLKRGDVLTFPGDQPHSYQNPGKSRNICISVVALSPLK